MESVNPPNSPDQPPPEDSAAAARTEEGLQFGVAASLDEVVSAWRLVYDAYTRAELIAQNPHHIHLAPHAARPNATVLAARIRGVPVSTLTAIADDAKGSGDSLPLDRVYSLRLQKLRREGHRLMEVGLFADRRQHISRSAESLLQFMRLAFFLGTHRQITDFVIGVHPRHVNFYKRFFGFIVDDEVKVYPAVNDHPVVLLRGNLQSEMQKQPPHPALSFFRDNPVEIAMFDHAFKFEPAKIVGSPIANWLADYHAARKMSKAG